MGSVLRLQFGPWLNLMWDAELERDGEMDYGRSIILLSRSWRFYLFVRDQKPG